MAGDQVVRVQAQVAEHRLELVVEAGAGHLVPDLVAERDVAVRFEGHTIVRAGQILGGQPEVDGVARDVTEQPGGRELRFDRLLAPVHLLGRLADHLDVAHRVLEVVGAEVEVVDAEGLLEHRRVRLVRDGEHRLAVVEHVVAPDLVGAVGETVGVPVVGRRQEQLGGVGGPARHDHHIRGEPQALASVIDFHFGDGGAGGIGVQPQDRRVGQHRDVRVLQRRADAMDLGVGLGVQAGKGSRRRTRTARRCCRACSTRRASRRTARGTGGSRRQRGRRRAVGFAARARAPGTGRAHSTSARSGLRRGRRARRRAARRACSRAPSRHTRSATPARCRRGGATRRSPLGAAGRARRRRAWSPHRRSSGPAVGTPCPWRRTRCRARCTGCRRRRPGPTSSGVREAASRLVRAAGSACPKGRGAGRACRRRHRCR